MLNVFLFIYLSFNILPLILFVCIIMLSVISSLIIISIIALLLFLCYEFLVYRSSRRFLVSLQELYSLYCLLKVEILININFEFSEFLKLIYTLKIKFTKLFFFRYFSKGFRFILNLSTKGRVVIKKLSNRYIIIDFLFTFRYILNIFICF